MFSLYPLSEALWWWPSLTKDMQREQLLCWSSMIVTEHTTSGSNEELFGGLKMPKKECE